MAAREGVAIVGYGHFGRALGAELAAAGVAVRALDPHVPPPPGVAARSAVELVADAGWVVLAVPVAATGAVLEELAPHLGPDQLVLDVGSVKTAPVAAMGARLGRAVPWVGTHPLFGPVSLALEERPLRAVVCPNPVHPDAAARAAELYGRVGCEVFELDPEEHDRRMAESHALGFFVAKGFLDAEIRLEDPLLPPSSRAIARTVQAVREDAAHLYASLHRENPYAADARRRLLEALVTADEALRAPPDPAEEAHHETGALHIDDLGDVSPDVRDSRAVIDVLDGELLDLLSRRTEAALRAARAKAALGRAVRDPRREAELVADRRRRAEARGLDGEAVEALFRAVLNLSRIHQARADD